MSSGVGKVYDEHREYLALCEEFGEEPVTGLPLASVKDWDPHYMRLLKQRDAKWAGSK